MTFPGMPFDLLLQDTTWPCSVPTMNLIGCKGLLDFWSKISSCFQLLPAFGNNFNYEKIIGLFF